MCHGNGPYGIKVSAEIWPCVHSDTPLSSPSACQTIFMHLMNFYPVPTMIAHLILPYSGTLCCGRSHAGRYGCALSYVLVNISWKKHIQAKSLEQWSNQSHFIHIQFQKYIIKNLITDPGTSDIADFLFSLRIYYVRNQNS